jgi:methionyl-tRNA formyltransferase
VINGESETGVTTMLMDRGLDTGDILRTATEPISAADTTGSLHDRLARRGAALLVDTLGAYADGTVRRTPQDHSRATYAPLLKKTDGLIDWKKPAAAIERFIRGMTPWPGAFTYWGNRRLKIFRAHAASGGASAPAGRVMESPNEDLRVTTGEGFLSITELQGASGTRLPASEFLRGCRIPAGELLG